MDEKTWLIIYVVIGWLTAIVMELQCSHWKNKHDEAITAWTIESRNKDKQILELQEELENMKKEDVNKVETRPVKCGKWECIGHDDKTYWYRCSVCRHEEHDNMTKHDKYCSSCGARMDGDTNG